MPDDDIPTTSLIREARGAYGLAIRKALTSIGLGELPRNSAYVLGAMDSFDVPFDTVIHQRRKSLEQSHTIDALLAAGCIAKEKGTTVLTTRGREAAKACAEARRTLDDLVASAIGADGYATMRAGLAALIDWKEAEEHH